MDKGNSSSKQAIPRLEKRSNSASSGLSSSSHEKRRRVQKSQTFHAGVSLKQARAAFSSQRGTAFFPAQRRNSNSPPRRQREASSKSVPQDVLVLPEKLEIPALANENETEIARLLNEQLQQDSAKIVARGLERLGSIFKHEEAVKCHQAVALDGPSKLLQALQKWNHDARVARHGCHTIFRMIGTCAKDPPSKTADVVESFLLLGGSSVILHTLQSFPNNCEVQLFGMGALGNLFGGRGKVTRAAAHKLVLEQRGVSILVQGMEAFPHHAKLQEFGCWVLARLCHCLASHSLLLKEEAVVAVATAVQNHPRSSSIDKQASNFMATLFHWEERYAAAAVVQ